MHEVDSLLTELASTCAFSSSNIRHSTSNTNTKRTPRTILTLLYTSLSPSSSGYLTQIILKDLRPILYPISETHYTASLLQYNARSVSMLSKEDAMKAWDGSGRMLRMYRVRASLEDAASAFESESGSGSWDVTPQVGVPVQVSVSPIYSSMPRIFITRDHSTYADTQMPKSPRLRRHHQTPPRIHQALGRDQIRRRARPDTRRSRRAGEVADHDI